MNLMWSRLADGQYGPLVFLVIAVPAGVALVCVTNVNQGSIKPCIG